MIDYLMILTKTLWYIFLIIVLIYLICAMIYTIFTYNKKNKNRQKLVDLLAKELKNKESTKK